MQIVYSSRRGSRDIEHIRSAHDDAELELLKAVARQRLAHGQGRHDRGRRPLRGIDEQIAKAEHAVAGKAPVKRNWFIPLAAGTTTVNPPQDNPDPGRSLRHHRCRLAPADLHEALNRIHHDPVRTK